jgi:hypothetical protein
MAESSAVVLRDDRIHERRLLQLQLFLHDLMQLGGAAVSIVRVGVPDLKLMQLLATARDRRARWSLGIGWLLRLRDESPDQFTSCAD